MRSKGNLFQMDEILHPALSLYIITDDLIDLSAKMGQDIHGILGGELFNQFVISINYAKERLIFYRPGSYMIIKNARGVKLFRSTSTMANLLSMPLLKMRKGKR